MRVLELLGITQSKTRTQRSTIWMNADIIIVAVGCVSLISRAWIFSAVLIALGVAMFTVNAVIGAGTRRKRSSGPI